MGHAFTAEFNSQIIESFRSRRESQMNPGLHKYGDKSCKTKVELQICTRV